MGSATSSSEETTEYVGTTIDNFSSPSSSNNADDDVQKATVGMLERGAKQAGWVPVPPSAATATRAAATDATQTLRSTTFTRETEGDATQNIANLVARTSQTFRTSGGSGGLNNDAANGAVVLVGLNGGCMFQRPLANEDLHHYSQYKDSHYYYMKEVASELHLRNPEAWPHDATSAW